MPTWKLLVPLLPLLPGRHPLHVHRRPLLRTRRINQLIRFLLLSQAKG
jgi:hypothetical protein